MFSRLLVLICLGFSSWAGAQTAAPAEKSLEQGSLEDRVKTLASIQPGLGVVMHEMGWRFANTYWAANGGNWGLAKYQLKELLEAQEVAEVTRPQRAPMLKANEQTFLVPLAQAIENKDLKLFNRRFKEAANACMGCHAALGYGYIRFKVPAKPPQDFLDFSLKSDPTR